VNHVERRQRGRAAAIQDIAAQRAIMLEMLVHRAAKGKHVGISDVNGCKHLGISDVNGCKHVGISDVNGCKHVGISDVNGCKSAVILYCLECYL
jgi:hypothetical protein